MSKTFTIHITHLMDGQDRTFFLFQEPPKVNGLPPSKLFANVFQIAPGTTGAANRSSTLNFTMTTEYFAIFGTKTSGDKVKVTTASFKQVKLGPNGSVVGMTTTSGNPKWNTALTDSFGDNGGFEFRTDSTFDAENKKHIWVGVGARDPNDSDSVIPLQTYEAQPNITSKMYPKVKYYVSTGDFVPGEFVDKKDIGACVQIDFQNSGDDPVARIEYTANGVWREDQKKKSDSGIDISSV